MKKNVKGQIIIPIHLPLSNPLSLEFAIDNDIQYSRCVTSERPIAHYHMQHRLHERMRAICDASCDVRSIKQETLYAFNTTNTELRKYT